MIKSTQKIYTPIGNAEFVGGLKIKNKELTNQQFFDVVFTKYISFTLPVCDKKESSHLEINIYSDIGLPPIKTINTTNSEDRKLVFGLNDTNGFFNIQEFGFDYYYQGNPVFVNLQEYYQTANFISWKTSLENKYFYSVFPTMNIDNYGGKLSNNSGGNTNHNSGNFIKIDSCYENKIIVPSDYIPLTLKLNNKKFYAIRGEDLSLDDSEKNFIIDISNALAISNLSSFNPTWYVYFGGAYNIGENENSGNTGNFIKIDSCYENKIIVPSDYIPVALKLNNKKFYIIRGEDLSLDDNETNFIIDISKSLAVNNLAYFEPTWYVYFGGKAKN